MLNSAILPKNGQILTICIIIQLYGLVLPAKIGKFFDPKKFFKKIEDLLRYLLLGTGHQIHFGYESNLFSNV